MGARGQLEPAFAQALAADPALFAAVVRALLDGNFPASMHEDLLVAAGLDLDEPETGIRPAPVRRGLMRQRDRAFRSLVLMAYEYRCAMCGFDGWLDGTVVGLDAAHVRWWMIGDRTPLTTPSHYARCTTGCSTAVYWAWLRRGAVLVSQLFAGRAPAAHRQVLDLAGQPIIKPQAGHPSVAGPHRSWHAAEVFRAPARIAS